jgi:hypothetical protein
MQGSTEFIAISAPVMTPEWARCGSLPEMCGAYGVVRSGWRVGFPE